MLLSRSVWQLETQGVQLLPAHLDTVVRLHNVEGFVERVTIPEHQCFQKKSRLTKPSRLCRVTPLSPALVTKVAEKVANNHNQEGPWRALTSELSKSLRLEKALPDKATELGAVIFVEVLSSGRGSDDAIDQFLVVLVDRRWRGCAVLCPRSRLIGLSTRLRGVIGGVAGACGAGVRIVSRCDTLRRRRGRCVVKGVKPGGIRTRSSRAHGSRPIRRTRIVLFSRPVGGTRRSPPIRSNACCFHRSL